MSQLLVIGNPGKRHKKRKHARRASTRRHKRKSARRHVSRRRSTVRVRARRNPVSSLTSGIVPMLKNGAMGAAGGIANDVLYGLAQSKLSFLPTDGLGRYGAKIVSAIVMGKAANMVLRGRGSALASGAVTCVIHDALREQIKSLSFLAGTNLGEYLAEPAQLGAYDPGMPVDGLMDRQEEMGEYLDM